MSIEQTPFYDTQLLQNPPLLGSEVPAVTKYMYCICTKAHVGVFLVHIPELVRFIYFFFSLKKELSRHTDKVFTQLVMLL
jgi:hypothetical protein